MSKFIKKNWKILLISVLSVAAIVTAVVLFGKYGITRMVSVSFITEGSPVEPKKIKKGTVIDDYPDTVLAGYSFAGWYTSEEYKTPWYPDDPIRENIEVYAKFNEIEPVIEEYHSNVYYVEDVPADCMFGIVSEKNLSGKDVLNQISFVTEFGEEPVLLTKEENGVVYVYAEGGFFAGGSYTVKLPEGMTFEGMEDYIDTFSFRVFKEEIQHVDMNEEIKYINTDEIDWEPDSKIFVATQNVMDKYAVSKGDILCINDGTENFMGYFAFVSVTEVKGIGTELFAVSVEDCEFSDIYDEVDVYLERELTSEEVVDMIDMAALEQAVYESGICEDFTMVLAMALNEDSTYRDLVYGKGATKDASSLVLKTADVNSGLDETDFSKNVTLTTDPIAADFDKLLKGVTITVETAMVDNKNFYNPASDGWSAVSITFTYETVLREKVKIKAELKLVESVNISAQGYILNTSKVKKVEFDYALNIYTETDLSGTILVCSTNAANELRGDNWINITDEINSLLGGDDDDSSDNLVSRMQEMLDEKGDYVTLLEVPILWVGVPVPPILPVFQVNIEANLVVKINFAAGLTAKMSVLDAVQIGIKGDAGKGELSGYTHELPEGGRYSYNMAACGYVGLKAGVQGKLTLSFIGLQKLGEVGAAIEIGVYTDLYGYTDMSIVKLDKNKSAQTTVRGGYYMPVGIYGSLSLVAESEILKVEAEYTLFEIKIELFKLGKENLLLSLQSEPGTYYMHSEKTNIKYLIPLEGEYMNLTNGKVHTDALEEDVKFTVMFSNDAFVFYPESGTIAIDRSKLNGELTKEAQMYVYYAGPNLLYSKSQNTDGKNGYVGKYTIRWIAPEADISEEDYGKLVKANYYVDVNNEKTYLGTREVTIGTVPGIWPQGESIYTISDEWNISPKKPISKDTDYVVKGSEKNVLVGFTWVEGNQWKTEVRAMSVGETPILPGNAGDNSKFKGWSVSYGSEVLEEYKLQTGIVNEATAIPKDCLENIAYYITSHTEFNELLFSYEGPYKYAGAEYLNRGYITSDGVYQSPRALYAVYVAEYEDCEVVFNSKVSVGDEVKDYVTVKHVHVGDKPSLPDYRIPLGGKFLGWDIDGNGTVDTDAFLTYIYDDMTFTLVYESEKINIVGMLYDVKTNEYTPKTYTISRGEGIPEEVISELSTPKADDGYSTKLVTWEYTLGNNQTFEYKDVIKYADENMVIKPVFNVYVTVSFDAGVGELTSNYYKNFSVIKDTELTLPYAQWDGANEYAASYAVWVDENGKEYKPGNKINVSKAMKFTAKYEHNPITYKVNVSVASAQGVLLNGQTTDNYEGNYKGYVDFVSKYDNYRSNAFEDAGYYYNLQGNLTQKTTSRNGNTVITDINLYWNETAKSFTLTFNAGGGHFYGNAERTTDYGWYGSEYNLSHILEIEPLERETDTYEYTLKGWKDGNGTFYAINGKYPVYGNATLTAVWDSRYVGPNYTYAIFIGGAEVGRGTAKEGDRVYINSVVAGSVYAGHVAQWTPSVSVSVASDGNGEYFTMPGSDITMNGSIETYILTFDAGEGSFVGVGQTVTDTAAYNSEYSLSNISGAYTIERSDDENYSYSFVGWMCSDGISYDINAMFYPTADRTFTAMWEGTPIHQENPDEHICYVYVGSQLVRQFTAQTGDCIYLEDLLEGTPYEEEAGMYMWTTSPEALLGKDDMGGRYYVMPDSDFTFTGSLWTE